MRDNKPITNLNEVLAREIKRNIAVFEQYARLANEPGVYANFAIARIKDELNEAVDAMASQDIVTMLKAFAELKTNEL